jgi:hypothetical protein
MNFRPRTALLVLVALLGLALVAGCGGDDKAASSSTDVNDLLKDTFSGEKKIDSGKLNLTVRIDAQGGSAPTGPISIGLAGAFQKQGDGKLPLLDLDATVEGAGQNIKAGVVSTGDKGFVEYNGTAYAVTDAIFAEFKKGYEQAMAEANKQEGQSLATLGIDPRRWLTNPRNAGEAKVGDDDAIRITGDVDINKLLDDVNTAIAKARSLGVQGSQQLPEKLTDEQKKQVADAIDKLAVEIYTGKDDHILRRMVVDLGIKAPAGSSGTPESAAVKVDFQLTDVNKDQSISAPADPKPFDQLLGQLGALGLGGSSASGSSGSGSGGASTGNLEKYTQCVEDAGSDAAKARKCADLLTP